MSLLITKECICCDACREECPNEAIFEDEPIYIIDADRCCECVDDYSEPACIVVCPVECIITDPDNIETADELKYKHVHMEI